MRLVLGGSILIILAALPGCTSTPTRVVSTAPQTRSSAVAVTVNAQAALGRVNAYRQASGLSPVRLDSHLMEAATAHSRAMSAAGTMSHDIGGSFSARMSAHGIGSASAVENIAHGQRSLDEVMTSWQNSSGHDANLKNSGMTRLGISVVGGYWTLIMASDDINSRL